MYTTYIRTTPERLWRGLTDPAFTRRYWGLAFESDWKTGSPYTLKLDQGDVKIADPAQVVLAIRPVPAAVLHLAALSPRNGRRPTT